MLTLSTRLIFFLLLALNFPQHIFAQEIKLDTVRTDIVQDVRIRELNAKKIEINEKTRGKLKGFRVQIYSGAESDMAKDMKSKFSQKYPNMTAYSLYDLPNFKVRVGDFRTKLEAQRFLKMITPDFPNSFVVQGDIELPKLD